MKDKTKNHQNSFSIKKKKVPIGPNLFKLKIMKFHFKKKVKMAMFFIQRSLYLNFKNSKKPTDNFNAISRKTRPHHKSTK